MPGESYSGYRTGEHGAWGCLTADRRPEDQAVQQLSLKEQQTQFASRMVWCMAEIAKMSWPALFSLGATLLVTFR